MDLSRHENRHQELFSKLDKLCKNGTLWDITLKSIDGTEIRAHKCVLVSQSEYFERMFLGGFRESTQDVVQINDISGDVLKMLINYMYTGILVQIDGNNVEEILNGADMLQIQDVRNKCHTFFLWLLCDESCLRIQDIADSRGMAKLAAKCLRHALRRFTYVIQHPSFLEADFAQLMQLLKADNLATAYEETVYKAIIKWVKYDVTERKNLLPDLLDCVRIVYTTRSFLLQEIKSEPLVYSSPECLEIVDRVLDHFDYKFGDPVSKIIRNAKPRMFTKRLTVKEMKHLRYYDCLDIQATRICKPMDILQYFKNFNLTQHYPKIEWNQYMKEKNFLVHWDKQWRGLDSTDEEDDDE